jgi:2TM domain
MALERRCHVTMLTTEEYLEAEFDYSLAEARRGFKIHAVVYALVNTGLITLNALLWAFADVNFPWAIFPLIGWGIGLAFHYYYGFRHVDLPIRARQERIEELARRPHVPA